MDAYKLAAVLAAAAKHIPVKSETAQLHQDLLAGQKWAVDLAIESGIPAEPVKAIADIDPSLIRLHGAIETPQAFMKRFSTPCDDDGNIEEPIAFRGHIFPVGTHREAIWLHLEKACPGFSVAVALGAVG